MRVVHLSCFVDPMGRRPQELLRAWPTLTEVAAAAISDGVEVTVVQAATEDALISWNGVSCHFVADFRRSFVPRRPSVIASAKPRKLAAKVRELEPDVVHLHGLGFTRQADFIARALRHTPVFVQDHADRPRRPRLFSPGSGLARGIAGVGFTSREMAQPFVEAGVLARDTRVFEILESSSRFAPGSQEEARAECGIYGDPCLLWVGRLASVKDPLTVLRAASEAFPRLKDPNMWCYYSDAPLLDEVHRRIAADERLASRVHLMGSVPHPDVEKLLRAADFLMLGSLSEGSGYAVIEALACGTTPLVTDIPAFRRITRNGAVGALSEPGNARAMAEAVIEWSERDRRALRDTARAHFERSLSFEVLGEELRATYRALLGVG